MDSNRSRDSNVVRQDDESPARVPTSDAAEAVNRADRTAVRPLEDAPALYRDGVALMRLGRFEDALARFGRALLIAGASAELLFCQGNALRSLRRWLPALVCYERALVLRPDYPEALNNCGLVLQELGRVTEALDRYARAIALRPDHAGAHYNRARALGALGRLEESLAGYRAALAIRPDLADAHDAGGSVLRTLGRHAEALTSYERALALDPNRAGSLTNRGVVLQALGRHAEALANHDRALSIDPRSAIIHKNRAAALHDQKRFAEALEACERALAIEPEFADALHNRAAALLGLKRFEEALEYAERALARKDDGAAASLNLGAALIALRRFDRALDVYDRAVQLRPSAEAFHNRGLALQALGRPAEAIGSFERALEMNPTHVEAWVQRGHCLRPVHRLDEAAESYRRALEIDPQFAWLRGAWLLSRMNLCDWRGLDGELVRLMAELGAGRPAILPWPSFILLDHPALQRRAAELWTGEGYPHDSPLPRNGMRMRRDKIRIGYYSADYHEHATAYLVAELFERHDRSRFELIAFSFGPDVRDAMRPRLVAGFDRFIDARNLSDRDTALLSRELGIDIAVDLKGYTESERAGVFAHRAAPIQVSYLGYPGTMGASFIDYLIADEALIPAEERPHYTEKIVYLPHSYQVNDRRRAIADRKMSRSEHGLPEAGCVFCCFNGNQKILPATFDSWMRILARVEGSVLWLLQPNETAVLNLRREAAARGIGAERLVFTPRRPLAEHLARHTAADLFLDTWPCNAHTTASDALWAGLPLLTLCGQSFASRVAASLLRAIGLPELIVSTPIEYESLAVELALRPERLRELRAKLGRNRLTTPLFDSTLFARHLEDAYVEMIARLDSGLAPDHIRVRPRTGVVHEQT